MPILDGVTLHTPLMEKKLHTLQTKNMTTEEINKAFEGRWRLKAEHLTVSYIKGVRSLCRDFFEAGVLMGSKENAGSQHECTTINICTDFDAFWNNYDKKVGREKCEKLWKKLSQREKVECLAYIPLYVQAQPDKQYRKNPETFLRNKSWHDELIQHTISRQQQQLGKLQDILSE